MAVDKSLVSGSMTMLLLKLLEEKDLYGYEMIETLRECSCTIEKHNKQDRYRQPPRYSV